jgi:large subunit ribosomal protein L21
MDAYAVVETGGKQYRVKQGDVLEVERSPARRAQKVTLDRVLAISNGTDLTVGTPAVAGATVTAEIVGQVRADKVVNFKKKKRKGYHRKIGHRQELTRVRVDAINA